MIFLEQLEVSAMVTGQVASFLIASVLSFAKIIVALIIVLTPLSYHEV